MSFRKIIYKFCLSCLLLLLGRGPKAKTGPKDLGKRTQGKIESNPKEKRAKKKGSSQIRKDQTLSSTEYTRESKFSHPKLYRDFDSIVK